MTTIAADASISDAPVDASSGGWHYAVERDRMRKEDTRIAKIESSAAVRVGAVETKAMMVVLQATGDVVPDVGFEVERGRLACDSLLCIHARFDDGKVAGWPGKAASGAVMMAGTDKAKADWIRNLKSASEAIVELDFAGGGRGQFTFRVSGFAWTDQAPPK